MPDNRSNTPRNSDFAPQSTPQNRPLPQNIEAEQSVLAACMLDAEAVEELVLKLKPENFFRPAHRIIFEAICDLNIRRIPIDQISLADTLNASGSRRSAARRTSSTLRTTRSRSPTGKTMPIS